MIKSRPLPLLVGMAVNALEKLGTPVSAVFTALRAPDPPVP